MDIVERKVENQVQFWSLIGPFFVLLSIAVLLFKVSPHWYFPVSALVGIPLCVKWKMKGMAAALCCLFLLAGISFQDLELDDRYWHVGLSLTMAFSFIVLTLSLEEAQSLIGKLQLESQSRLDNFLLLDEKWKGAELEWSLEKEKAKTEIATLTQEVARIQEEKQTFYKLAQLAKDELMQLREQHDHLLQDVLYKKQQITQLNERLEGTELTIQEFVNSDSEKQIEKLNQKITELDQEKERFQAKFNLLQEEKEHLCQELQVCQEREKRCLMEQSHYEQDKQDLQNALQILQSKCHLMEQEKESVVQMQATFQQQCEQMRHLELHNRQAVEQLELKIRDLEKQQAQGEKEKEILQWRHKELEEEKRVREALLKQKEEEHLILLQEMKNLEEQYRLMKQNFEQTDQHLEEKNHVLNEVQEKLNCLSKDLSEQQLLAKKTVEENEKLEKLKIDLGELLDQARQDLEETKQKHQVAEENLFHVRQKLEEKNGILSDMEKKVHSLSADLLEQRRNMEHYQRVEEVKVNLEQVLQATQENLQEIKEKHECVQQDLAKSKQELEFKNGTLVEMQEQMVFLKNQFAGQEILLQDSIHENQRLKQAKLQLEEVLQQVQEELQKEKSQQKHSPPQDVRQIQAMYKQLKQQFQEKCQVLDATRQELFRVNEELTRCQKEYEEEHIFDQSVEEKSLQYDIFKLQKEWEETLQMYETEIEELTLLIRDLLTKAN